MRVENENAREFYMQEAVKSQWSTRQLERQINSFFYERLLSSKNKEQVAAEIQTLEPAKKPEDIDLLSLVSEYHKLCRELALIKEITAIFEGEAS